MRYKNVVEQVTIILWRRIGNEIAVQIKPQTRWDIQGTVNMRATDMSQIVVEIRQQISTLLSNNWL